MACQADRGAARWRGGLVGACSAALAIGAHGVGGGELPGGAALAMLVLGCAVVGVGAGSSLGRGLGALVGFLIAGQALGHVTLALASGHLHGLGVTADMLAAHLGAALVCAALIGVAERFFSALAGIVWQLVRALTGAAPADLTRRLCTLGSLPVTSGVQLGCSAGTRGPPRLFV